MSAIIYFYIEKINRKLPVSQPLTYVYNDSICQGVKLIIYRKYFYEAERWKSSAISRRKEVLNSIYRYYYYTNQRNTRKWSYPFYSSWFRTLGGNLPLVFQTSSFTKVLNHVNITKKCAYKLTRHVNSWLVMSL